jgi:lipoprotein-anchoring transpeptidase ErfK/SrfK
VATGVRSSGSARQPENGPEEPRMAMMTLLAAIAASALLAQSAQSATYALSAAAFSTAHAVASEPQPPAAQKSDTRPRPTLTAVKPPDIEGLRLQVALDRAGFSPGLIDGRIGSNTKKALAVFNDQGGGSLEDVEPLKTYTVTDDDAAGPFAPEIPQDLVQQGTLPALGYRSVAEALSERFHTTPAFLQQLNPEAQFAPGEQIQVPNVEPMLAPVQKPEFSPEAQAAARQAAAKTTGTTGRRSAKPVPPKQPDTVAERPDVIVTVSKSNSSLSVADASGRVIFYAPVTTGSERDPLPVGEWKVNGIQFNPPFNYNPDLFWDANPAHSKAKIPPGPNNPVGLVWIDLSKEHYGIHGTPEPSTIGHMQSHGCVRMTNWDVRRLLEWAKPGTLVVFR